MIRRSTWILLAVFLLALAGAYWFSQREPDQTENLTPTTEPLWFLPEADIESLTIEDLEAGVSIRAEREPEVGWLLLEPEAELADVARIERAVTSLQLITPVERLETEAYSQYGLDEPNYRIVISLVDDSIRALAVGRLAPTGDVYYTRLGETGDVLFLQRSAIQSAIELVQVPPVVTPTPELTATIVPE